MRRIHVIRSEVSLPAAERSREEWRAELGLADGDLAACMLGHLHVGKDHDTLLRAWRLVVDALEGEGRRCVLLLAGRPAGTHHAIKALAFDLALRDRVRFLGDVEDVSGLLEAVDLAVFSSRSEALGRGATEPMYAGLPVVATDVPGIREAVGEPGLPFLAPPGEVAGLADSILRLARDAELRARVGTGERRADSGQAVGRSDHLRLRRLARSCSVRRPGSSAVGAVARPAGNTHEGRADDGGS